jgi:uncharacterized membrane protein
MIYPLIRLNRAITAVLVHPQDPVQAIAFSEIGSVVLPLLNPLMYKKIIGLMAAMSYAPNYSNEILKFYTEQYDKYNYAEICCLLFFILAYSVDKYY